MPVYCLTIRKCTPVKTLASLDRLCSFYEAYISKLKREDVKLHIEYHYENVIKQNGGHNVHVHAMLKTPNTPHVLYKKGYSVKLELCKSQQAWQTYITKNNSTKQSIRDLFVATHKGCEKLTQDDIVSEDTLIDIPPESPKDISDDEFTNLYIDKMPRLV